ncbi:SRPBCC family protein [Haliea sp. E17]|uniref:SRPBCC family protein n=1 Tax=Haliea sp. E17 TaxID=3401576 RepID=UPI003AAC91C2
MFETTVSREFSVTADTAWSLLADWGNTAWLPGLEKTEVVSDGGCITRRLFIPGAEPIEETLLASDQAAMTIDYTIAVSTLFQLADYRGHITVVPTASGCRVDWHCQFDPGAMSEEEASGAANGNLDFLLSSLAAYLEPEGGN